MLHIDLHDEESGETIRIGTVSEFQDMVLSVMKDVAFTSKVFSTKGVVDPVEMKSRIAASFDHVLQRARDAKA